MKKFVAIVLMLAMVLAMTACGGSQEEAQVEITRATEAPADSGAGFSVEYEGLRLVPGDAFDAGKLPEAESVYEVPSCAIEGTDNVYSYGSMEVTAFNEGDGEKIYSVYLMEPGVKTDEGLAVGDAEARITEIYGQEHQGSDNEYLYVRGTTELSILVQDGAVVSIEFRQGK